MNERIRELYDQCWFGGFGDDIAVYQKDLIINESIGYCFDSQKFAELIVRECGNVAWQHTPDTEKLEYSHLIKDKILEHFGVEE
jgi:hypothetical protein